MADKDQGAQRGKWFWVAILLLLFVMSMAWFARPLGKTESPQARPNPRQTEWTVAPSSPAVEVTLPQYPLAKNKSKPAEDRPADAATTR